MFFKFSEDKITAITGHKSEQNIAQYADTDLEDHRKISLLISHNAAGPQATIPHCSPHNQSAPLSFLSGRQPLQPIQQGVNPPTFTFNGCTININYLHKYKHNGHHASNYQPVFLVSIY